jgi:hypothetical protein
MGNKIMAEALSRVVAGTEKSWFGRLEIAIF